MGADFLSPTWMEFYSSMTSLRGKFREGGCPGHVSIKQGQWASPGTWPGCLRGWDAMAGELEAGVRAESEIGEQGGSGSREWKRHIGHVGNVRGSWPVLP